MPLNSAEVAAMAGQYQQMHVGQSQYSSFIGGMSGLQGSPGVQADQIAGGLMNRVSAIGAPLASLGVGLMGLDPMSIGIKAGMGAYASGAGLAGAGMAAALIAMVVTLGSRPDSPAARAETPPPPQAAGDIAKTPFPVPTAPAPAATEKVRFGPLTRQHLAQYEEWIKDAPRQRYFLQLLATDATHTGELEGFLARAVAALEPAQIRVYRSSLSGRDRVGVIFGDFDTREEAVAAMQTMPDSIKTIQPFPRQVSKLK